MSTLKGTEMARSKRQRERENQHDTDHNDGSEGQPTFVDDVDPSTVGFGERLGIGDSYSNPYEDERYR